jgi:hypothetical protein
MNIEEEILTTKSICSNVYEGGEQVGHIMLLDYDNEEEHTVMSRVDELPGVTAVFESSGGSFHAWNLSVGDLKTTACRQVLCRDDYAHVRNGISAGNWRLRLGPKSYRDGEVYKSRPELVTVGLNPADYPQSRPHMDLLTALEGVPEPPMSFDWIGETAGTDTYETMTDKLKERWRGGDL